MSGFKSFVGNLFGRPDAGAAAKEEQLPGKRPQAKPIAEIVFEYDPALLSASAGNLQPLALKNRCVAARGTPWKQSSAGCGGVVSQCPT